MKSGSARHCLTMALVVVVPFSGDRRDVSGGTFLAFELSDYVTLDTRTEVQP